MLQKWTEELKHIYDALGDEESKTTFKHRLLYSLLGDKQEISNLVNGSILNVPCSIDKICYYGAGGAAAYLISHGPSSSFVIDKYKTGTIAGCPIISLNEFLNRPDCREYLIIITVCRPVIRYEIQKELESYGLNCVFGYSAAQYFEFIDHQPALNEYYVDAGAYDGLTVQYFFENVPNGHAYVFEPNPQQFENLKETLPHNEHIDFFPYGLYNENKTAFFQANKEDPSSSHISNDGQCKVEVRRLDDVLGDKKVTFIKMDIEGAELAALQGAKKIICEQKPKLAICIYHKPEDIWQIPGLILSFCPNYRLYLRHYSVTDTETVLYAII